MDHLSLTSLPSLGWCHLPKLSITKASIVNRVSPAPDASKMSLQTWLFLALEKAGLTVLLASHSVVPLLGRHLVRWDLSMPEFQTLLKIWPALVMVTWWWTGSWCVIPLFLCHLLLQSGPWTSQTSCWRTSRLGGVPITSLIKRKQLLGLHVWPRFCASRYPLWYLLKLHFKNTSYRNICLLICLNCV